MIAQGGGGRRLRRIRLVFLAIAIAAGAAAIAPSFGVRRLPVAAVVIAGLLAILFGIVGSRCGRHLSGRRGIVFAAKRSRRRRAFFFAIGFFQQRIFLQKAF